VALPKDANDGVADHTDEEAELRDESAEEPRRRRNGDDCGRST
jgi:hypothetical protein